MDKNLQSVNEEASENVTKNGQDMRSNKCNQCKYESSRAGNLRTHLKRHNGEKSNKCNQCDFAFSYANVLRTHLKAHSGEKTKNATSATMPSLMQAI